VLDFFLYRGVFFYKINYVHYSSQVWNSHFYYSSAFYHVLQEALIHLRDITTLELKLLPNLPRSYLTNLKQCSFPNLRALHLDTDLSPSILALICRHNLHVRDLKINSHAALGSLPRDPICRFPMLDCYSGDFKFMASFLPGSRLRSINVEMFDRSNLETTLAALGKNTVSLEMISVLVDDWDIHIFKSVSRYAPDVLEIVFEVIGWGAGGVMVWWFCSCPEQA
jgi:hypothetical protein